MLYTIPHGFGKACAIFDSLTLSVRLTSGLKAGPEGNCHSCYLSPRYLRKEMLGPRLFCTVTDLNEGITECEHLSSCGKEKQGSV